MSSKSVDTRFRDIQRFYELLDKLKACVGGMRILETVDGRMKWPNRGVYFFFGSSENRTTSGDGPRVVRVGAHALGFGSNATLWDRLITHRGSLTGKYANGGNHRASVFRKLVGTAIINKDFLTGPGIASWGIDSSATKEVRLAEHWIEHKVSNHMRSMPFLWVEVDDPPGPYSDRRHLECNAIALLSNYNSQEKSIDPPSSNWLGRWAKNEAVQLSGLWNSNHVKRSYDPELLELLNDYVLKQCSGEAHPIDVFDSIGNNPKT